MAQAGDIYLVANANLLVCLPNGTCAWLTMNEGVPTNTLEDKCNWIWDLMRDHVFLPSNIPEVYEVEFIISTKEIVQIAKRK